MELSSDECSAVEALGQLFKLTEVHLWDDGSSVGEAIDVQEPIKFMGRDHALEKSPSSIITGFDSLSEDLEVAETMSILGLPLSFRTNKEKRNGLMSGKRKGRKMNSPQCLIEIDDTALDLGEKGSLFKTNGTLEEDEMPRLGMLSDLSNLCLERVDSANSTACTSTITDEHDPTVEALGPGFYDSPPCVSEVIGDGASKGSCLINEDADCNENGVKMVADLDTEAQSKDAITVIDGHQTSVDNSGEWMSYWDDHYMKLYYYNVRTEESTWDPPLGMEQIIDSDMVNESSTDKDNKFPEHDNDRMDLRNAGEDVLETHQYVEDGEGSSNSLKRKKRGKRSKSSSKLSISAEVNCQGVLRQVTPAISKYWSQRYLLFSRFDRGIRMDEEGWFSVTPETLSKHHAVRCAGGVVIDFFAGVGGNAIQFAQRSKHVIAIDIDPNKIDYARHNAAIYGVSNSIDFIMGDSFSLASALKADTVFMSPPWGGPDYSKVKKFDMTTMLKPHDGKHLFDVGTRIASKIVMFLPRNVDLNQLAEISLSATPPWSLEVEKNYLNGRLKAITAYFSEPSL